MRRLLWIVIALGVLWSAWWLIGSTAVRTGLTAFFDDQRARGATAEYSDLAVRGFPNRFDVTLTDPHFADPASGDGWRAPFFQVFALSYQPQHYIAVWPHQQTLTLAGRDIAIASTDMRASLVFVPGPSFVLNRMTLVAEGLAVDGFWSAQTFRLATRRSPGDELAHDLGVEALAAIPPASLKSAIDPGGRLPPAIDRFHVDATLGFDRRIDRTAIEAAPDLERLSFRDLTLNWGDVAITLTGDLTADGNGYAEGDLRLRARNWALLLDLAVDAGLVPADNRTMFETALRVASGDKPDLDAPVTLDGGAMRMGLIPLGPAPRLQ